METDEMFEGYVEESDDFERMYMESEKRYEEEYSKGEYCHEQSFKWGFQEGYDYAHENEKLEINLKNGYEFKDDNGNVINTQKIIMEKKKIEYPKTYEECCKILGLNSEITNSELLFYYPLKCGDYITIRLPEMEKFEKFIQLYLCRNAYWKLYGEEMGLGKPWEPDWNDKKQDKHGFYNEIKHTIISSTLFVFPTAKMRDFFKENFDPDIEFCKEFL